MAGQGFSDADNQAPLYFKPTQEMLEEFSYLGTQKAFEIVVENPNRIAEMCEVIRPVPEGTYPPSIEGSAEDLQRICYTHARELYGDPLPKEIEDRIEAELQPIIHNGFDVMYMTAQKLIKKSNDAGYPSARVVPSDPPSWRISAAFRRSTPPAALSLRRMPEH